MLKAHLPPNMTLRHRYPCVCQIQGIELELELAKMDPIMADHFGRRLEALLP